MKKYNKSYEQDDFKRSQRQMIYSIFLVGVVFVFKLFGGLLANSLALLSDSLHLITDFIALIISWYGLKVAMKPANYKYTFGHYRHSILTALINNIFLIFISLYILYKAVLRYMNPVPVESTMMIFFSSLGIVVNILILLILRGNSENMNVKSALLHFIGDAIGDASVLIGAIIIYFTGMNFIDTLLSVILSILILRSAIKMTIECIKIFLEAVPSSIDIEELKKEIKNFEKVIDVKDIHIWSLSKEVIAMTAHISLCEPKVEDCEELLHSIQHTLKDKFNISHSTIQIEHDVCCSCFHNKEDHNNKCKLCIDNCPESSGN